MSGDQISGNKNVGIETMSGGKAEIGVVGTNLGSGIVHAGETGDPFSNLTTIAEDLAVALPKILGAETTDEQKEAIPSLLKAKDAAHKGDKKRLIEHPKTAGKHGVKLLISVSAALTAKAIEMSMNMT